MPTSAGSIVVCVMSGISHCPIEKEMVINGVPLQFTSPALKGAKHATVALLAVRERSISAETEP